MHTKIIEDPATDLYIHNFRIQITFGVNIIIQALQGSHNLSQGTHSILTHSKLLHAEWRRIA